jgi:hypothetical protein
MVMTSAPDEDGFRVSGFRFRENEPGSLDTLSGGSKSLPYERTHNRDALLGTPQVVSLRVQH